MKKFTSAVWVACLFGMVNAADSPPASLLPHLSDGRIGTEQVVQVEGASATELYSRAKAWVANTYKSAPGVTKLDDPQGGRLVIKGVFRLTGTWHQVTVPHTWTIEVKDGRYRYSLSDLEYVEVVLNSIVREPLEDLAAARRTKTRDAIVGEVAVNVGLSVGGLKVAMTKPSPAASNW